MCRISNRIKEKSIQLAGAVEYADCISTEGLDPTTNACYGYDIKQFDGKAPALELRRMWSTSSLPLLPGPLLPGVVAPNWILSMGQIEMFDYLNCVQAYNFG